ncbi:hypothetical protein FIBSPDRAFT_293699 [Athelia psychrophila]|uniref:Uncharacterized protein n=1 Tax=Athelia psychrophila TaxID=1759441 RepID=A0A167XFV3_9AGAM|nr:hypothetical protein FIBSPDRAFT_293699 [Fibularhizoctonia sp. CBS 109695]
MRHGSERDRAPRASSMHFLLYWIVWPLSMSSRSWIWLAWPNAQQPSRVTSLPFSGASIHIPSSARLALMFSSSALSFPTSASKLPWTYLYLLSPIMR